MTSILKIVGRKGLFDSVYHATAVVCLRIRSFLALFLLRARGIRAAGRLSLGGRNVFFASAKYSIELGENVRFGRDTRLDAGYGGVIRIGNDVLIDDNCFITAQQNITVGNHVQISAYCFITDFNHNFGSRKTYIVDQGCTAKNVRLEDDVWIGSHCSILPGVTIGKGAIVGAGSVVTKSVPPYAVAAGNPAKVLRQRP